MTNQPQKDWEKEFDKKFPTKQTNPIMHPEFLGFVDEIYPEDIKPFISKLLSTNHQATIQEAVGVLEELLIDENDLEAAQHLTVKGVYTFNKSLRLAIEKLNQIKARE